MPELRQYQRDHYNDKIYRVFSPKISEQEIVLTEIKSKMVEESKPKFAKKFGLDKLLNDLEYQCGAVTTLEDKHLQSEEKLKQKSRDELQKLEQANGRERVHQEHKLKALKRLIYSKIQSNDLLAKMTWHIRSSDEVEPKNLDSMLTEGVVKIVKDQVKFTPEGKKLQLLEAMQQKCRDTVMEANAPDEITRALTLMLKPLGMSWEVQVPMLENKKAS
tara:strand:- start:641 stop:1294 length:654 start_codon:yes stop_codon:yes gene_type:complete